ncbi:MAG: hydroxysqualene dehydroxylase HpnE [Planctomycetota bacterium]
MSDSPVHGLDGPASADGAPRTAVVVGGGVAGLSAAVRLAQAGVAVTLVESRKRVGGRAGSMHDPELDAWVDNCQHVLLRGCTHLIDFYKRLQVYKQIRWHSKLYFEAPGGVDVLAADDLPAPMHLFRSMLGFTRLSPGEKWAVMRGLLAVMQVSRRGRAFHADESFGDWLRARRQPPGAVSRFWEPVVVSACNARPDHVAAHYALQVFQEGFLYTGVAYEMGLSEVPLADLYEPAGEMLAAAGGEVLTASTARRIDLQDGRVAGVDLSGGRRLEADAYVSALPADRLADALDTDARAADPRLARLDGFHYDAIIGAHLVTLTPDGGSVLATPHLVLSEGPFQWLFDKGASPDAGQGHRLHAVASDADALATTPAGEIAEMAWDAVRRACPRARDAELLHHRVIVERRATFRPEPGVDRLRPPAAGALSNLFLAGDWTATGWPSTMEGACRSGYNAAAAALEALGLSAPEPIDDLAPGSFYQLLSA